VLLGAYMAAFCAVTAAWALARLRGGDDIPTPAAVSTWSIVGGEFQTPPTAPTWSIVWGRSAVHVRHWHTPVPTARSSDPYVRGLDPNSSGVRSYESPGLFYAEGGGTYYISGTAYAYRGFAVHYAPLWWATFPALPLAAAAYARHRRRRRSPGVCAGCGYDLRATPERCPECGTVPARAARPVDLR